MPRNPAPTRRATSSATSRSRPKKYLASTCSKLASPLKGQSPSVVGRGEDGGARESARLLPHELEVDHPARQLVLDVAEITPARSGTGGDVNKSTGRLIDHDRESGMRERPAARVALIW